MYFSKIKLSIIFSFTLLLITTSFANTSNHFKTSLAWSSEKHPERQVWDKYLKNALLEHGRDLIEHYPKGIDEFSCNYKKFSFDKKLNFWASLISEGARYESSFDPAALYIEKNIIDVFTKLRARSRGLMQMSIGSVIPRGCQFSVEYEKSLGIIEIRNPFQGRKEREKGEELHNVQKNLECTVIMMKNAVLNRLGKTDPETGQSLGGILNRNKSKKLFGRDRFTAWGVKRYGWVGISASWSVYRHTHRKFKNIKQALRRKYCSKSD